MSKRYNREIDQLERLERENRELKSTVRSLLKQLKKLNKGYYRLRDADIIDDVPKVVKKMCFLCGGEYRKIIIHNRSFRRCQECNKTGRIKIING